MSVIAVNLDGGIVQSVGIIGEGPLQHGLVVIDYDTNGIDPSDLIPVPQQFEGNKPATFNDAYIVEHSIEEWPDTGTTRWLAANYA